MASGLGLTHHANLMIALDALFPRFGLAENNILFMYFDDARMHGRLHSYTDEYVIYAALI